VVHDNGALLVVDLGIEPRVADVVDDMLLGRVGGQAEQAGQFTQRDARVDLAVALEHENARVLDELAGVRQQEEVAAADLLGENQLLLGILKVEVDEEGVDELCHGVLVLVRLLLDDTDDVLEVFLLDTGVLDPAAGRHDGHGQVPQNPGSVSLDRVDVGRAHKEVENRLTRLVIVEEGEESPMHKGSAVLQLRNSVLGQLRVDQLLNLLQLLHGGLPIHSQNLAGQSTPCRVGNLVVIGRQNTEAVEKLGGVAVVAAAVVKVAEVEKGVNHLDGDLVAYQSARHVRLEPIIQEQNHTW